MLRLTALKMNPNANTYFRIRAFLWTTSRRNYENSAVMRLRPAAIAGTATGCAVAQPATVPMEKDLWLAYLLVYFKRSKTTASISR